MDASQVTGSTSSYARKYALNGLFCIDDVKDADNQDNTSGKGQTAGRSGKTGTKTSGKQETGKPGGAGPAAGLPENRTETEKVTPAMIKSVQSLVEKYSTKGLKMEKILKMYSIRGIAEMDVSQYKDCMGKLELYKEKELGNE